MKTVQNGLPLTPTPLLILNFKTGRAHSWPSFVRQLLYYKLTKHDGLGPTAAYNQMTDWGFNMNLFGINAKDATRQMKVLQEILLG